MVMQDGLRASWVWQEREPGWTAQLAVVNEGEDDVFCHVSQITETGLDCFERGARVVFDIGEGKNGKTQAVRVALG